MKKITLLDIGYYHPSNADWNYYVHIVIDGTGARCYRSTFGREERMLEKMRSLGYKAEKLPCGVGSSPEHKWKDIKYLKDIEEYTGENW